MIAMLFEILQEERKIMSTGNLLDQNIIALQNAVANETTLDQSVIVFLNGIPALISAAVIKAQAAGATASQLASLTALQTAIAANTAGLAGALTTNTPAADPTTTPDPGTNPAGVVVPTT